MLEVSTEVDKGHSKATTPYKCKLLKKEALLLVTFFPKKRPLSTLLGAILLFDAGLLYEMLNLSPFHIIHLCPFSAPFISTPFT